MTLAMTDGLDNDHKAPEGLDKDDDSPEGPQ